MFYQILILERKGTTIVRLLAITSLREVGNFSRDRTGILKVSNRINMFGYAKVNSEHDFLVVFRT